MPAQLKMLMPAHCSQLSTDWLSQLSRHLSVHWLRIHLCTPMCALYATNTSKIKANSSFLCQSSALICNLARSSLSPLALSDGWDFPGCGGKCFPKVPSSTHPCSEGRQINMFSSCCITLKHKKISVDNGWSLKKSPLPCNVGGLRHWPFISVSVVGIGPVIYSETNVSAIHNAQPIQPSICIHSWLVIDKDKDNKNTNTQKLKNKYKKQTKIQK